MILICIERERRSQLLKLKLNKQAIKRLVYVVHIVVAEDRSVWFSLILWQLQGFPASECATNTHCFALLSWHFILENCACGQRKNWIVTEKHTAHIKLFILTIH